jgi:hypothetical protein
MSNFYSTEFGDFIPVRPDLRPNQSVRYNSQEEFWLSRIDEQLQRLTAEAEIKKLR